MAISGPEALTPAHILDEFSCGKPSLDRWLRTRATLQSGERLHGRYRRPRDKLGRERPLLAIYTAVSLRAFFVRAGNLLSTENPTFSARIMVAIVSKRGLAPGASVLYRLSRPRPDAFATSAMPRALATSPSALSNTPGFSSRAASERYSAIASSLSR